MSQKQLIKVMIVNNALFLVAVLYFGFSVARFESLLFKGQNDNSVKEKIISVIKKRAEEKNVEALKEVASVQTTWAGDLEEAYKSTTGYCKLAAFAFCLGFVGNIVLVCGLMRKSPDFQ